MKFSRFYFFIILTVVTSLGLGACDGRIQRADRFAAKSRDIRVLIDQAPQTLNPRMALDANGQRLGALVFSALTRVNEELEVVPDLAERWTTSQDGKRWRFEIRKNLKDHSGVPITPTDIVHCLESYRVGEPPSRLRSAFPHWTASRVEGAAVLIDLKQPDAYLTRNLSSLRFFRINGQSIPCSEPKESGGAGYQGWVGSGPYRIPGDIEDISKGVLRFVPADGLGPTFVFSVVRDELQRVMALLRGEVDVAQNALSLTRTRWLVQRHPERFQLIERPGVNVSYIAFNLKDSILSDLRVRKALALAVPRQEYVDYKMARFGTLAGSMISPLLPEGLTVDFEHSLNEANAFLDEAGWKRDSSGIRFKLKYRTTPVREGMETALVLQNAWEKLGVRVELDIVEPAAFLTAIRKGAFQLYSSRWVGVADGSILHRTLRSGSLNNRVNFKSESADVMLDRLMSTAELEKRIPDAHALQRLMMEQLPYFPLWHWGNAVILSKQADLQLKANELSLSGAYEPLLRALSRERRKKDVPEL